jgi:hypothetical protein
MLLLEEIERKLVVVIGSVQSGEDGTKASDDSVVSGEKAEEYAGCCSQRGGE